MSEQVTFVCPSPKTGITILGRRAKIGFRVSGTRIRIEVNREGVSIEGVGGRGMSRFKLWAAVVAELGLGFRV